MAAGLYLQASGWWRERTKLGGGLTGEMVTERPTNREQSDYSPQARHTTMLDRQ